MRFWPDPSIVVLLIPVHGRCPQTLTICAETHKLAYSTNMKTLLTAIKTRLQTYSQTGETLASIKTWKRGILPPLPVFPALVLLPVQELFHRVMSGGTYWVDRIVEIRVYQKSYQATKHSVADAMDLMNALKDIIRTEYQWVHGSVEQCADTLFGDEDIGDWEPFRNAFVQRSSMRITCRSQEAYPTQTVTTTLSDVAFRPFIDNVYATLQGYQATTLSAVKTMEEHTIVPIPATRFPAIAVNGETEQLVHEPTSVDTANRNMTIRVWTHLLDKESLLDANLDIVEAVKDILQINYAFGGRCRNSEIQGIRYGQAGEEKQMLYESVLSLSCEGVDVLPAVV